MKPTSADYWEMFPILSVLGGVIVSKRGDLTVGWEMTLPETFSLERDEIENCNGKLMEAVRMLPPWFMLHRQDIYTLRTYTPEESGSYLGRCFERHFEGRRSLAHRQYLFLTLSSKKSALKGTTSSGVYQALYGTVVPKLADVNRLKDTALSFISKLKECPGLSAKGLQTEELIDCIERYRRLGHEDRMLTDLEYRPDRVVMGGTTLWSYTLSETRDLPFVMTSSRASEAHAGSEASLYTSTAAATGPLLDCEHIVNTYILTAEKDWDLTEVDSRRRKMSSMSRRNAENRNNAEELGEFLDSVHQKDSMLIRCHMNVMVWTGEGDTDVMAKVTSAISSMGCNAVLNTFDTPVIFYAGMPGASCELGADHLMKMELEGLSCLSLWEGFAHGVPGGTLKLCDRLSHVPVTLDIHEKAAEAGLVTNYNTFILGESGAGKSFFTNHLARSAYDNGESVFIVDMGGSYEGLCSVIHDESGGEDGFYHEWNRSRPLTFDGFWDFDEWTDEEGRTNNECAGLNFMMGFLQTISEHPEGWSADQRNILMEILRTFAVWMKSRGSHPVMDDLNLYLGTVLEMMKGNGFPYNGTTVRLGDFNMEPLIRSVGNYCTGGPYGFLLNSRKPRNLISSRFTVFDMTAISQMTDRTFLSAIILCIMNTFSAKMQRCEGFKTLIIDEAWVAIANETMAPFLNSLWKTSRKYSTSAMVVTQQLSDIMKSAVVKDTIIANSSIRAILRDKGQSSIDDIVHLLGLTHQQKAQVLSLNKGKDTSLGPYQEVFLQIGSALSGTWATEVSPQEATAYESKHDRKQPFMELSGKIGAVAAIKQLTGEE